MGGKDKSGFHFLFFSYIIIIYIIKRMGFPDTVFPDAVLALKGAFKG